MISKYDIKQKKIMSLLTNKGYIISSDNVTSEDRKELTVHTMPIINTENIITFHLFCENNDGTVVVPRYWAKEKFGNATHVFNNIENADISFSGNLNSEIQHDAVKSTIHQLRTYGGGILSLPTGTGKTVIALYIACKLKLKTLIVVHKQILLNQWVERISQFVPSASIGIIQQNNIDVDDCDIVVGMLQSISLREYDLTSFGLTIFDEVHVVPAPVFSRTLLKHCSPYMLGLSATPERRDGLSQVLYWFIGPVFYKHELSDKNEVTVHAYQYFLPRPTAAFRKNGSICMVTVINILTQDENRNNKLINILLDITASGYKVLLLSDRRNHCLTLKSKLEENYVTAGLYLGGMKKHELDESRTQSVILATYGLAKEGLDIPSLDALVLAHPRSDVVQACGRVLHSKSNKPPIIVDIIDQWFMGKAQWSKRETYYKKSGFLIEYH